MTFMKSSPEMDAAIAQVLAAVPPGIVLMGALTISKGDQGETRIVTTIDPEEPHEGVEDKHLISVATLSAASVCAAAGALADTLAGPDAASKVVARVFVSAAEALSRMRER